MNGMNQDSPDSGAAVTAVLSWLLVMIVAVEWSIFTNALTRVIILIVRYTTH